MAYGFYPIVGAGVFWIGLVIAIILFSTYRKIYPVFYMISVSLYIFTASFMIDIFHLGKLAILSTLIFSAVVFMGLGRYLSKVLHLEHEK
jgi:hypothetical protein